MYNVIGHTGSNNIGLIESENDRLISQISNGKLLMSGARRDGRNPSTGARSSRKSGIATTYVTGYPPNFSVQNESPIY